MKPGPTLWDIIMVILAAAAHTVILVALCVVAGVAGLVGKDESR